MLGQTDLHIYIHAYMDTHKHRPANFFSGDPPEEIVEQKPSMLRFEAFLLYDSELLAGIAYRIALCQNRRSVLSGFKLTTALGSGRKPCHGLAMVCPSRTVSFLPHSDQTFLPKEQTYEITIHVPLTRAKGAPTSLTQTAKPIYSGYRLSKFEANLSIGLACTLS